MGSNRPRKTSQDGRERTLTDHLPRLHILGRQLLCVTGYNGRGIAPGTVLGREVARHIRGELRDEEMPLPISPLRRVRLRRTREWAYELGSTFAHGIGIRTS
jgi:glycine/D-amino acid oxidase-like deaminating enzyme